MKPALRARWTELAPLLDQALDLPVDQRSRFVQQLAGDDELRGLLAELLDSSATPGILDGDRDRYAEALLDEHDTTPLPAQIGPYRILRLIGEGGGGSVFLAEREADGYVQQVALKLLRLGVRDPNEQERFRRERRILARLQHPSIARLLDGGFDVHGVPWFALEYIDGEPLTRWCDGRRLGVEARLRLFDEVCAAVAYAHRALIVHRDLKPANILVDADARPHLLDFGIARLLDTDTGDEQTRTGLRRMTPAYAAPEQFDGGAITTATDVYALGVLLHELLTGLRPSRSPDAEPAAASATLAAASDREALAAGLDNHFASLRRALQGDLDTIIGTALATDPLHRYPSVEALAADLRRHRSGHPISARRTSLLHRFGKFVARQRLVTALAGLLVASLIVGIAMTLRESRHARDAAQTALHEAQRAEAVKNFVLALFGGVTPDESKGRSIGARELLERGEARLAETLASQGELESELSTVLAGAWRQLGSQDRAATLAERAVAVADSPVARHAAQLELGAARAAQGRYEDAERVMREALASAGNAAAIGETRVRLAELLADRGHPDQALDLLATSLDADRYDPNSLSRDIAALGRVRFRAGDLPGAESALRDAIERSRMLRGERHTETASREHDLAVVLLQRGATADAAALLDQALVTRTALLGERHPDVASSLNSLAMLDYQQGRNDAAIRGLGEALVAARGAYGDQHPTVATMLGNLASIERASGRIDAAARDQRAALAITEAALGSQHYLNGIARLGLAGVLVEQGRDAEALDEQRRALTILEAGLGKDHGDVMQARAAVADSLLRAGRIDEAAAILPGDDGVVSPDPRKARIRLVQLRMAALSGDCEKPVAALPDVTAALARGGSATRADLASAEMLFAGCLRKLGRSDDAATAIARTDRVLKALPYQPKRIERDRAGLR